MSDEVLPGAALGVIVHYERSTIVHHVILCLYNLVDRVRTTSPHPPASPERKARWFLHAQPRSVASLLERGTRRALAVHKLEQGHAHWLPINQATSNMDPVVAPDGLDDFLRKVICTPFARSLPLIPSSPQPRPLLVHYRHALRVCFCV